MTQRKVIVRGATNQALDELDATDIPDLSATYEAAGATSAHTGDTSDAHDASAISFTPAGTIASTDVQAALQELDTDSRMSDSRAPTGSAGGDLSGTYPNPSVVNSSHDHDATTAPGDPHTALRAVDFLVGTATGELSGEIVAGTSPGGELGGSWGTPTVDTNHAGARFGGGGDVSVADTNYVTVASESFTIAAGNRFLIDAWFIILNNSGGTKTYTVGIDVNGFVTDNVDGTTVGASATSKSVFHVMASVEVRSTSLSYTGVQVFRQTLAAANSTQNPSLSTLPSTWNTSGSNITGAGTVRVRVKSSANTATQTLTMLGYSMRQI